MPHSGGYLPGAFAFKPIVRGDASMTIASSYGSIAASTKVYYTSSITSALQLLTRGATTDIQFLCPSDDTQTSYKTTWSLENTDAGNAHDGGWYYNYWNA